jgi:hypothetical protein
MSAPRIGKRDERDSVDELGKVSLRRYLASGAHIGSSFSGMTRGCVSNLHDQAATPRDFVRNRLHGQCIGIDEEQNVARRNVTLVLTNGFNGDPKWAQGVLERLWQDLVADRTRLDSRERERIRDLLGIGT